MVRVRRAIEGLEADLVAATAGHFVIGEGSAMGTYNVGRRASNLEQLLSHMLLAKLTGLGPEMVSYHLDAANGDVKAAACICLVQGTHSPTT